MIKKYLFLVIIGIFALFSVQSKTFLRDPPVWPDEAIYADIIRTMRKDGSMGTNLWIDTVPGIQNHAFIYPPVFFYILFWWSNLTSLTIVNQRLLSVIVGSFSLFVSYHIMKQIRTNNTVAILISLSLLAINYVFLKASRINRPEIFVLTFGLLSIYYFLRWLSTHDNKSLKYLIVASVCSSLAALTHLIGTMFIISLLLSVAFLDTTLQWKKHLVFIMVITCITPIIFWFIQNYHVLNILFQQTSMAYYRKTLEETWFKSLLYSAPYFTYPLRIFITYVLSLILLALSTIMLPSLKLLLLKVDFEKLKTLLIYLYVIWFFTLYGKMFWYYVFPVPFTYILVSILLSLSYKKYKSSVLNKKVILIKYIIISASLILGITNIQIITSIQSLYKKNTYSYNRFIQDISKNIPSGSKVFLSAIPSPYHGLLEVNKKYIFYQFPVYKITYNDYNRLLNSAEYIVFNGIHDNIMGTYIVRYIKENTESSIAIGNLDQYRAKIIKLVSPDKRKRISNNTDY